MKKIISLFVALAIMFSFCTLSAYAATDVDLTIDAAFGTEEIKVGADGATTLTLTFNFSKGNPIFYGELGLDFDGFEIANPEGETSVYAKAVSAADSAADEWEYVVKSGVLYFESGDAGFASGLQVTFDVIVDTSSEKTLGITADVDNSFFGDERDKYNYVVGDINMDKGCTVKAAQTVNTVAVVEDSRVAVTTDGTDTDCQIGSGIALTVNTEVAFTKMIWALTIDGVRSFTKDPIVFDVPAAKGDVKFAATFINGSHSNNGFAEDVPAAEISDVDAIFYDGAADYFTNAADAEYKNK